ncbi:hepatitis A virus cellular receptor 1-like isoform X2 [Dendropsophus ebraccatus]
MCWGRGSCPHSKCNQELIWTDGHKVTFRASSRYQLRDRLNQGIVSLTITQAKPEDAGTYCCRIEHEKTNVRLTVEKAPTTVRTTTTSTTTLKTTTKPTTTVGTTVTPNTTVGTTITPTTTLKTTTTSTTTLKTTTIPTRTLRSNTTPTTTVGTTVTPNTTVGTTITPTTTVRTTTTPTTTVGTTITPTTTLKTTTTTPPTTTLKTTPQLTTLKAITTPPPVKTTPEPSIPLTTRVVKTIQSPPSATSSTSPPPLIRTETPSSLTARTITPSTIVYPAGRTEGTDLISRSLDFPGSIPDHDLTTLADSQYEGQDDTALWPDSLPLSKNGIPDVFQGNVTALQRLLQDTSTLVIAISASVFAIIVIGVIILQLKGRKKGEYFLRQDPPLELVTNADEIQTEANDNGKTNLIGNIGDD